MKRVLMLLVPALLLVAVALTLGVTLLGRGGSERVATSADGEFPEFVYQSARAERGYRLAVDNRQLFTRLRCYCGCGLLPNDAHRYLLDCFMNDDGTFDAHASGCGICIDIAEDGVAWQAEGKSTEEVRRLVDEKYENSGPPTTS